MIKAKIIEITSEPDEVIVKENFSSFSIELETRHKIDIEDGKIEDVIDQINSNDNFSLTILIDNGEILTLNSQDKLDGFLDKLDKDFKYYEDGEPIKVKLEIFKGKGESIIIYSYSDFLSFFNGLNLFDMLEVLNEQFKSNTSIRLQTLEPNIKSFSTATFTLNADLSTDLKNLNKNLLDEHCHFGNSDKYVVNPYFFHPINTENKDFLEPFNSLCSLMSMIYIFDISSITDKNLFYKINGFKAINGEISIDQSLGKCKELFFELFEWCYSNDGNIADKLEITRNIISIHFKDSLIELEKGVLTSVKSAFKTYLKENVSKYIELRGKIQDELNWIAQKSGEIVDRYISSYQRSIFTFLSFFISVFVLRIISKGSSTSVFNKDATLLSLAFLGLSIIFLIFSSWNLSVEKNRLERKYQNLKDRFKDLLVQKDIENILNGDSEFDYELGYIRKRYKIYLALWILTILILLITVLIVSDYITFEAIKNKTCG